MTIAKFLLVALAAVNPISALCADGKTFIVYPNVPVTECRDEIISLVESVEGTVISAPSSGEFLVVSLGGEREVDLRNLACALEVWEQHQVFPQPRVGRNN